MWVVVAGFAAVTVLWSFQVGLPFRDPEGRMFRGRLASAVIWLTVLVVLQAVIRSLRAQRSLRGVPEALRAHWPRERILLVFSGLLAYHVVYVCYRNLKSWNAFRTLRDEELTAFETWLFAGHSPAALLHDLFGQGAAALVLVVVYRSFTYLVPFSVLASLVLVERVRDAYVFLTAAMWVWILGAASYYLLPSLGPFAETAGDFTGLPDTAITVSQTSYLTERAHILVNPGAGDAFASLGAFASLHVAFTCMVLLMLRHYRAPGALQLAGLAYLLGTMVATVYFGWHYVVDDVAGVLIAVASVALARAIVQPRRREADDHA
ncbi:MAG: phosphatase PAP2 family protein [Nocardioides sp.]